MKYTFGDCEFDTERFELRRHNHVVEATPQVLKLLNLFLVSRSRLVTKQELVDEIWDGRAISDAAITVRIRALRQAIGEAGSSAGMLKTVRGMGFRFSGDVKAETQIVITPDEARHFADRAMAMRNQPSIAVLPAKLFGNWEENGFLAQALPDEILTSLARVRSFLVLARGSTAELRSFEHSPSEIGAATGATYSVATEAVLDGPNIEISCELSDCRNDNCLWRERVRIKFSEIHELREDIVNRISKSIDQAVSQNELRLARMQAPGSLSAWQNYFVGNSLAERYVLEDTISAKDHFQRAVELDPSFARAHAGLGLTHHSLYYRNWVYQTGEQAKLGMEAATRGYELDPSDPLCTLALSRQYFAQRQNDVAVPLLKRVVEMSPSSYFAQSDIARILAQTGDPNDADAHLKMVETLYPEYSSGVYAQVTRGLIALSRKDVDGAIQVAGTIEDLGDLTAYSTLLLLTTYHLAGEQALAAQTAGIIREKFKGIAGYKMIAANMGFHDGLAEVIEDAYAAHGLN